MRLCVIGKYPPIQGGVSARTYWTAHRLAGRGHEVHVVTNAREVQAPYRMHMRADDWRRCEGDVGEGRVVVHWTDPADRSQTHIPMGSAFVSKLCGLALAAHAVRKFDLVYSHYMEPYGIAAHLAAQAMAVPHVVRMAGSDAGRLWRHPQFEPTFDHVLRSAQTVLLTGMPAARAVERGIDPARIAFDGGFAVPEEIFAPDGPVLDIAALREELADDAQAWGTYSPARPHFGIYGKLGRFKGSFALLDALARLKSEGHDVGLVALAHGDAAVEARFRARVGELGLEDRVLQLPFLPHWRVPSFLRGCLAVCCLEQDFPIAFHSPAIAREVLLAGRCLVASTEIVRRLHGSERLPDGYGCVAIPDVNDTAALARRLGAIVADPSPAAEVGRRGRDFAVDLQRGLPTIAALERILVASAARRPVDADVPSDVPTSVVALAAAATGIDPAEGSAAQVVELDRRVGEGDTTLAGLAEAARLQSAVEAAQALADESTTAGSGDPLFRVRTRAWAIRDADFGGLVPYRAGAIRIVAFEGDLSRLPEGVPGVPARDPGGSPKSFIVAFARGDRDPRPPLIVDQSTARAIELCDGARNVDQIARHLSPDRPSDTRAWIEELFVLGLIGLRDPPGAAQAGAARAAPTSRKHRTGSALPRMSRSPSST